MKKLDELNLQIDYSILTKKWQNIVLEQDMYKWIKEAILSSNIIETNKNILVSVTFADSKLVKKLNNIHRNKNSETNILSIAANDFSDKKILKTVKASSILALGDIILAFEVIKSESELQNKAFKDHLAHLMIHSTLHLLGYDHEDEEEAEKMENLEIDILKKFDISSPYII